MLVLKIWSASKSMREFRGRVSGARALALLLSSALALPAFAAAPEEVQILVPSDASTTRGFGAAIAVDGDRAVIGAPFGNRDDGTDAAAAYVFQRTAAGWVQDGPPIVVPDASLNTSLFGQAVALDGDTIVVGAKTSDALVNLGGAAYVFVRTPGGWVQQQRLAPADLGEGYLFGGAVAVRGDRAIIGATSAGSTAPGGSFTPGTGAAYVFERVAGVWQETQKVISSDIAQGDQFGVSVAIDGDTALIGASTQGQLPSGNTTGAAYFFVRGPAIWTQQKKVLASDAAVGDRFGIYVALDGDNAIISAQEKDSGALDGAGATYVFVRTGTDWNQQAKLVASDPMATDFFGSAVSIEGDAALIGAAGNDDKGLIAGAAYLFERSGTSWGQTAKLFASDATQLDQFGSSTALAGAQALVGAQLRQPVSGQREIGAAYVYDRIAEPDRDGDGIPDAEDACPGDPQNDADHDGLCGDEVLYFSPTNGMTIGGVAVADEDVVRFQESTGSYSLFFDGSDVGLSTANVDAFHRRADGSILLSFAADRFVPGVPGLVEDEDLVRFVPTSLGSTTAGTFQSFFVGDAHGLTAAAADIDGVFEAADGTLYLSMRDNITAAGLAIADEDIVRFNPATNNYTMYFDGSDVGIPANRAIDAFDLQPDGTILMSFDDVVTLPGLPAGTIHNVVRFVPTSLGSNTAGHFEPFFVGGQNGTPAGLNIDAFARQQ